MSPVPSIQDWQTDPQGALTACGLLAQATAQDGDSSAGTVALGVAAEVLAAAAPVLAGLIPPPFGALATGAIIAIAGELQTKAAAALAALDPSERALIDQAIAAGVGLAKAKLGQI